MQDGGDPDLEPRGSGRGAQAARPTIADVARIAGVSVTTAARALSGRGYSSAEARRRVQAAAETVGYVPNFVARSLRHGRTNTIGLLVADVENSYYSSIAKNVEALAAEAGYSVMLCNTDENPAKERELLDLLEGLRIAGVIMTPTGGNKRRLQQIQRAGIVIVQIDRVVRQLAADAVLVDNEAGAYEAVTALIDAGHQRVGLLAGHPEVTTGSERTQGYLRALEDHGVPLEPTLMAGRSFRRDHALEDARELVDRKRGATAIFAANNILAEASVFAVKEAGLNIPADISLVAFDDVEWMRMMDRPITAVRQPIAEMASAATQILLRRLRGDNGSATTLTFRPSLVLRDSITPPSPSSRRSEQRMPQAGDA